MPDVRTDSPDSRPSVSLRTVAIVAVAVALLVVAFGIFSRMRAESSLATRTDAQATPVVTIIRPTPAEKSDALTLPGSVQAYNSAAIYARTTGYIRRWFVDIGDSVRAGQVLAVLDAPEVDQQVAAARADLQTAQANRALAQSTAARWNNLLSKDAVSKQETDEKAGDLAAKTAIANAASANVRRLGALQGFTRLVAPFSGVVTSRSTQIGALVTAGHGRFDAAVHRRRYRADARLCARAPALFGCLPSGAARVAQRARISGTRFRYRDGAQRRRGRSAIGHGADGIPGGQRRPRAEAGRLCPGQAAARRGQPGRRRPPAAERADHRGQWDAGRGARAGWQGAAQDRSRSAATMATMSRSAPG